MVCKYKGGRGKSTAALISKDHFYLFFKTSRKSFSNVSETYLKRSLTALEMGSHLLTLNIIKYLQMQDFARD